MGLAARTVLCVVPSRSQQVAGVAFRQYLYAVTSAVELAIDSIGAQAYGGGLRLFGRTVDTTYQALLSTVIPRWVPFTATVDRRRLQFLRSVSASQHHVRDLLTDAAG
jgi:hypothetical protein